MTSQPRYGDSYRHIPMQGNTWANSDLAQIVNGGLSGLVTGDWHTTPAERFDAIHNASVIVGPSEIVR